MNMLDEGKLYYEDATPFLLLKELIEGFQTNRSIKHVLVDEAQDYSPFQFEFLKVSSCCKNDCTRRLLTKRYLPMQVKQWISIRSLAYTDRMKQTALATRSYRSTKPIIEFTRALVPEGKNIHAFERDGEKPTVTKVSNDSELHEHITVKVAELQKSSTIRSQLYVNLQPKV